MNKKIWVGILAIVMILSLSGCSLAKEEQKSEGTVNEDIMIGVLITEGHVDIIDAEEEINVNEINGEISFVQGKRYATIDKKGSDSPSNWEVSFEGVDGIAFYVPEFRYGDGKYDSLVTGIFDEEMSDVDNQFYSTDNSHKREITGTVYVKMQEGKEYTYFMNPVYQTESGEIYVTTGNGMALGTGERDGGLGDWHMNTEATVTKDGESVETVTSINLEFELMYETAKIKVHQMDLEHNVIKTTEYEPGNMPEEMKGEDGTVYVLVETERVNFAGETLVERELGLADEDGKISIDSFYEGEHGAFRKQTTAFINY